MHCAKDKVAWHVCGRNELTHRVFHSLRLGDRNDLRPQIRALEWRLAAAETGYVQAGPYRDSGQLLLDWLDEDDSRKRFELGLATVRQYRHEHTPKVEIPDYVVQLAAWLRL